jgi:leucine-rich repeat protein SHOC2
MEVLDLSDNKLEAVPAELGGLSKLHTLWLDANQLTSLPAELGRLTALQNF